MRDVDCSRYSTENSRPECEDRLQVGLGVFVVVAVLLLAIGIVLWRRMMRKVRDGEPPKGDVGGSS